MTSIFNPITSNRQTSISNEPQLSVFELLVSLAWNHHNLKEILIITTFVSKHPDSCPLPAGYPEMVVYPCIGAGAAVVMGFPGNCWPSAPAELGYRGWLRDCPGVKPCIRPGWEGG
jgi:hypothetical protein